MSESKQIVHATFWFNKIWQLGFIIFGVAMISEQQLIVVFSGILVLAGFGIEMLYINKKCDTKPANIFDTLYFTQDERDREIALKVHNALLMTYGLLISLLFGLLICLWVGRDNLAFSTIFYILFGWVALALIVPDIQYYVLWNKYDNE